MKYKLKNKMIFLCLLYFMEHVGIEMFKCRWYNININSTKQVIKKKHTRPRALMKLYISWRLHEPPYYIELVMSQYKCTSFVQL